MSLSKPVAELLATFGLEDPDSSVSRGPVLPRVTFSAVDYPAWTAENGPFLLQAVQRLALRTPEDDPGGLVTSHALDQDAAARTTQDIDITAADGKRQRRRFDD